MANYSQQSLLVTIVIALGKAGKPLATDELYPLLEKMLSPWGDDLKPYAGRKDSTFSQTIRNFTAPERLKGSVNEKFVTNIGGRLSLTDFGKQIYNAIFAGRNSSAAKANAQTIQTIYFGAPGVGKSHNLKSVYGDTDDDYIFRVTFHPETDYASFVGCYKPVKKENVRPVIPADELIAKAMGIKTIPEQINFVFEYAESILPAVEEKGLLSVNKLICDCFGWNIETYFRATVEAVLKERSDNCNGEISYEFCPQAFVKAYVKAWTHRDKAVYLVIEEINRGNCAQIFGDIFQLLDRGDDGYSTYEISPDHDLEQYLKRTFMSSDVPEPQIKDGSKMKLPPNLHIIATMNTSDQSLFPIDSAFKRRWDWAYMPIETRPEGKDGQPVTRTVVTEACRYDWGEFLEAVNRRIFEMTRSEDKQLGFWFVKTKGVSNEIEAKSFVSKVLFYLWNDVFKDYTDDSSSVFNFAADGNPESNAKERHSFMDFTSGFGKVNDGLVDAFMRNLGVTAVDRVKDNGEG